MAKITDLIWHVHSRVLLSLYIWEVDGNGQRGEAEKKKNKDSSTSDTSILCTRDRDLWIPIKANRLMTKCQCFRILLHTTRCPQFYSPYC